MMPCMKRSSRLFLVLLLLAGASVVACTKGDECDVCETDSDCKDGFVCVNFLDGGGNVVGKRCGSGVGASTCRVR